MTTFYTLSISLPANVGDLRRLVDHLERVDESAPVIAENGRLQAEFDLKPKLEVLRDAVEADLAKREEKALKEKIAKEKARRHMMEDTFNNDIYY